MINEIRWNNEILAIVVRSTFSEDGVNFVTPETTSLQVGILKHSQGTKIKPHQHNKCVRTITETPEVLYLVYGMVLVQFYVDGFEVANVLLSNGDLLMLLKGGHGFTIMKDSKIIEVKQGPYEGINKDKTFIKDIIL